MVLTREHLINVDDADYEQFEIPSWGMVRIRSLSAAERLWLAEMASGGDLAPLELFDFYARLLAVSLVDADNKQLFDANNVDDLKILQRKSWPRLEEVGRRILAFNRMATDEEGAEKN